MSDVFTDTLLTDFLAERTETRARSLFDRLWKRDQYRVNLFIARWRIPASEREDWLQEVSNRLWKGLNKHRLAGNSRVDSFAGFACIIARNLILDRLQKGTRWGTIGPLLSLYLNAEEGPFARWSSIPQDAGRTGKGVLVTGGDRCGLREWRYSHQLGFVPESEEAEFSQLWQEVKAESNLTSAAEEAQGFLMFLFEWVQAPVSYAALKRLAFVCLCQSQEEAISLNEMVYDSGPARLEMLVSREQTPQEKLLGTESLEGLRQVLVAVLGQMSLRRRLCLLGGLEADIVQLLCEPQSPEAYLAGLLRELVASDTANSHRFRVEEEAVAWWNDWPPHTAVLAERLGIQTNNVYKSRFDAMKQWEKAVHIWKSQSS